MASAKKKMKVQLQAIERVQEDQSVGSLISQDSIPSIYDVEDPHEDPHKDEDTHHDALPPHDLLRQEIFQDFYETERVFLRRMHTVMRLFVLPLRAQNSKIWITGVPPEVTHLFDWLEDILNLHSQILAALHSQSHSCAVLLKALAPRLEVYQPYLVRLEEVAALIERLVGDEGSEFGEFVELQQLRQEEGEGWSLERYLIEPVDRLAQYPNFFRVSVSPCPIPLFIHCGSTPLK